MIVQITRPNNLENIYKFCRVTSSDNWFNEFDVIGEHWSFQYLLQGSFKEVIS